MQYPITTICGSMRYFDQMINLASKLTGQGYIVLSPFITSYAGNQESDDKKAMLDDMHRRKIDMSTSIHVVGSYIGESTHGEIQYAKERHISIFYVTDEMMGALPNDRSK